MRAYVAGHRKDWSKWLDMLEFAYNTTPNSVTGRSPFFLLHGYEPRGPSDFLGAEGPRVGRPMDAHNAAAEEFLLEIMAHRATARDALAIAQAKQARSYNAGR